MRVDVARLSEDRELELQETWGPVERDLNAPGLEFDGPLRVAVWVKKDGGVMAARIRVEGTTRLTCARCTVEFGSSLSHSFRLVYPIDAAEKQWILDDHIREELILAYPARIMCREDCRGLCPRCGEDLNDGVCRCKRNENEKCRAKNRKLTLNNS